MVNQSIRPAMERMLHSLLTRKDAFLVPGMHWPYKLRRLPKCVVWPEHAHTFHELAYVDDGVCAMVVERQAHRIPAGGICLIPSGKQHYEAPVAPQIPYTIYWVHLCSSRLSVDASRYSPADGRLHPEGAFSSWVTNEIRSTIESIENEIKHKNAHVDTILRGYLIALTGLIHRQCEEASETDLGRHPDEIVRKAARYIQHNYHRAGLTVGEIANHVALNACYFSEYFKAHAGCTPYRYLLQRRMEQARHLLCTTDWTISRIAEAVGFSSPYHFSASFKRFNNVAPTDFRRLHGAKSAV